MDQKQSQKPGFPEILEILSRQNKQIDALLAELKQMKSAVSSLKPINVNYTVEQLKVETLDGTLNIGVNPSGEAQGIEDFSVGEQTISAGEPETTVPMSPDQIFRNNEEEAEWAVRELETYMQEQFPETLVSFENQYQYPLTNEHKAYIKKDLERQLSERIQYYLGHGSANAEETVQLIKNDIQTALQQYMERVVGQ